MDFKIFGDRVLLQEPTVEADQTVGGIFVPESATRSYLAMEVVALGDGRVRALTGALQRPLADLKPGDRVLVQTNPMMMGNSMQKIGGKKYLTLNYHDLLARIDAGVLHLTLDALHPLGRWVFVRIDTQTRVGDIWLPDSKQPMQSAGEVKTYLAKAGALAQEELGNLPIGARVMLDHSRVNPMQINRQALAYIDVGHVAGATDEVLPEPQPQIAVTAAS
jgi:co-chaperonin GroES (HSP10)